MSPLLFGNDLGHGMEGGKDTMGPFARFLLFLFGFLSSFGITLIATCRSNNIVDTNSRTVVVENGASDYYIDDLLVPGLKRLLGNYQLLKAPTKTMGPAAHVLLGTATATVSGIITDKSDNKHKSKPQESLC